MRERRLMGKMIWQWTSDWHPLVWTVNFDTSCSVCPSVPALPAPLQFAKFWATQSIDPQSVDWISSKSRRQVKTKCNQEGVRSKGLRNWTTKHLLINRTKKYVTYSSNSKVDRSINAGSSRKGTYTFELFTVVTVPCFECDSGTVGICHDGTFNCTSNPSDSFMILIFSWIAVFFR